MSAPVTSVAPVVSILSAAHTQTTTMDITAIQLAETIARHLTAENTVVDLTDNNRVNRAINQISSTLDYLGVTLILGDTADNVSFAEALLTEAYLNTDIANLDDLVAAAGTLFADAGVCPETTLTIIHPAAAKLHA